MAKQPWEDDHPWGGTVLETTVRDTVYDNVVYGRFPFQILDMGNSIAIRILNQIRQKIENSVENLISYEQDTHFLNHNDAFTDYYLVNTLSSSIFEASAYLLLTEPLCYEQSQRGSDILSLFDEGGNHSWYKVEKASTVEEKRLEAVRRLPEKFNNRQYRKYIGEYFDVDNIITSDKHNLSNKRGTAVHSLLESLHFRWDDVEKTAELWREYVNEVFELLNRELSIHEDFLIMMQD